MNPAAKILLVEDDASAASSLQTVLEDEGYTIMPVVNGRATSHGRRQPCSQVAEPAVGCDLQGGQRYTDRITGLKLLCIRPGQGPLYCEGRLMTLDSRRPAMPRHGGSGRHLDSHAVATVRDFRNGTFG